MTEQELQEMIAKGITDSVGPIVDEAINKAIAPLQETQRKYEDIFINKGKQEEEKKEPGFTFTRAMKCLTLAKNDPDKALFYACGKEGNSATGMYPNDNEVKALLKALSVTTPSEGGFLVGEQYSRDIIPLLRSKIAAMQLGVRRVPMPNGNMNIPKLTGGASSYYVGENQNATKSQETFGNIKLSSKKLVTLVPVSNDLIRNASVEADMMVRDDMIQAMALKVDWAALYGSGSEFEPRGIKRSITTANYTVSTAAIDADLPGTMISQLMTDNIPMISCGWEFNSKTWGEFYNLKTTTNQYIYRDEMNRGMLNGFPFRVSNQITTANSTAGTTYYDLVLGDFSELLFGEELAFEFMASNEATYDVGGTLYSTFSLDQTVMKITQKHDFALRHDAAFRIRSNYHSS